MELVLVVGALSEFSCSYVAFLSGLLVALPTALAHHLAYFTTAKMRTLSQKAIDTVAATKASRNKKAQETSAKAALSRALELGQHAAIHWVTQKREKTQQERFDPDQYNIFKHIPKYILALMLTTHCDMTTEDVDCIEYACFAAGVRFLVAFFFGIHDGTAIPRQLDGSKYMLANFFFKVRHERLGERGQKWRGRRLVKDDFTLDWTKDCYDITWIQRGPGAAHPPHQRPERRHLRLQHHHRQQFRRQPQRHLVVLQDSATRVDGQRFFAEDLTQSHSKEALKNRRRPSSAPKQFDGERPQQLGQGEPERCLRHGGSGQAGT